MKRSAEFMLPAEADVFTKMRATRDADARNHAFRVEIICGNDVELQVPLRLDKSPDGKEQLWFHAVDGKVPLDLKIKSLYVENFKLSLESQANPASVFTCDFHEILGESVGTVHLGIATTDGAYSLERTPVYHNLHPLDFFTPDAQQQMNGLPPNYDGDQGLPRFFNQFTQLAIYKLDLNEDDPVAVFVDGPDVYKINLMRGTPLIGVLWDCIPSNDIHSPLPMSEGIDDRGDNFYADVACNFRLAFLGGFDVSRADA